jgi:hypothetical protein
MQKEDWQRIAKWIGWVYLPIVILAVLVFLLVEWNAYRLSHRDGVPLQSAVASTTE